MALHTLAPLVSLFVALSPGSYDRNADILADPFAQIDELLPTPTATRNAAGAPGHDYWQQKVDYDIDVELDDEHQRIIGSETIKYRNQSPDELKYLWLQLDANIFSPNSEAARSDTTTWLDRISFAQLRHLLTILKFDGSVKITGIRSGRTNLRYKIVDTMMRVELPKPLKPGQNFKFSIDWNYAINDHKLLGGRTGYEYFEDEDNYIYEIAQWFPRLAAYTDATGWQHKQYLGRGEFTLEFGDYHVEITVPEDHVVAATGVLKNARKVLTAEQRQRLETARNASRPSFIVTPEEAQQTQKTHKTGKKTWVFEAENVRDFAFASSRKFIWDAQGHHVGANEVMAMSYYPIEGEPLWSHYSTAAIIHTLNVYSRYTFQFPYPTAISVNGPVYGMEYPMICFNGPRPEEDGTYSPRSKYGLISVIIHEVGHNFFPMIVSSDERQWTWMDEGLNTFVQFLSEQEWEKDYPSRRGDPRNIVDYMRSRVSVPIMTNSESLLQFGNNAYAKPATALNILRETVLGRELFDYAFREYAQRWMFKHPNPADFFRTMEDASGIDLDWFWRGWFFTTGHVDQALVGVHELSIDSLNPDVEKPIEKRERDDAPVGVTQQRNETLDLLVDQREELKDFYNTFDPLDVTETDRKKYKEFLDSLEAWQRDMLASKSKFYVIDIENAGDLVMPVILKATFVGGGTKEYRFPAEVWRFNPRSISKIIVTDNEIESLELDPYLEIADTDLQNNHFPPKIEKSRFEMFVDDRNGPHPPNPMQEARDQQSGKQPPEDGTAAKTSESTSGQQ